MNPSYSGSHLRERDQLILEKHEEEINALQAKFWRLKYSADEISKNLFDASNRGRRLAESLGFNDVFDAQVAIDSAEHSVTYRECLERLQIAEAQLSVEKKDVQILQAKLHEKEQENKKLAKEKRALEVQYDDLKDKKERAAERYKADYKKYRELKAWLFSDDKKSRKHENEPGITQQEKLTREKLLLRNRAKAIELVGGSDISEDTSAMLRQTTAFAREDPACDKENDGTPMPPPKKRRIPSENATISPKDSHSSAAGTPIPLRNSLLKSVINVAPPSSSPTVFFNSQTASMTRVPLSFQPIPDTIHIPEEPSPVNTTKNNDTLHSSPLSRPHIPCSSDTEDDSQAVFFPSTNPRTGKSVVFKVPAPPPKAGPSHQNADTPHPSLPSRPLFPLSSPELRRNSAIAEPMRTKEPLQLANRDRESGRPAKMRRLSDNGCDRSHISSMANVSSSSTSEPRLRPGSASTKGKEREIQNDIFTPLTAQNMGQKRIEDYSAFKGRGRYGKTTQDPKQSTINALYTIDPARNGGLAYQYDEVVRSKDERRKMDAGDCECCREYYESVGPLPSRLQQPLWRSPPATPVKPCPRHLLSNSNEDHRDRIRPSPSRSVRRQSDIELHKKAISRHRHAWARATTPPGYWNIGFPDTQEVGDINDQAKEIHKRKKDDVDKEAAVEGGRYRRR
ncbi:hypothetical protein GALMADRAFT_243412 [Galerina marginata CBS 339.88]|uniref:DNA endonuclease activator Ctp1 C-terminal domain-containing protein n=1 Tax=Galerina marginata (strain CBS 339.88) TaxID=685588 RepID=A0A067TAK0_GALM3|nr:hypothetical protein GALMADRAFT_243412 [Galerina marginata CBS 339.88]